MRIERRYTEAGKGPFEAIEFRKAKSEIRNPGRFEWFSCWTDIDVPARVVASCLLTFMAQKYFRKAGVPPRLKKVEENTVPSWLWRRCGQEGARNAAGRGALYPETMPARCLTGWPAPGPIGAGRAAISMAKKTLARFRRIVLHAGHPDGRAQFPAMVQYRPALGLWHRWPGQGHYYVDFKTGKLNPLESHMSIPSPMPASSSPSVMIWSMKAASWICGCAKRACSNTAPAPAPTFHISAAKTRPLSGGGKSSGLMSFLKIGDRAAGAIKSGGTTTRRAAKMVVVDIDHPDIEDYIDWKVKKSRKLPLSSPARSLQQHLNDVMKACVNCEGPR